MEVKVVEDGEFLVKGLIVFKGYFKNEKVMVDMFVDGWLYIGDVVEVLLDGFFFIVDCKKDIMINVVGKNLMLLLIENMMKVSFYIKECIVIVDKWLYVLVLI